MDDKTTSITTMLSEKAKHIYSIALVIILFSVLDALTTFIALSSGKFEEANRLGNAILEVSPLTFYTMGTVHYLSIGILMITLVQFRPSLFRLVQVVMIVLAVLKLAPVVWNLLNMGGVI
ncbi:MAG: hypothetical protein EOM68_18495 [Spirochaetia bacterium]|nr:hypothetical protein [Spirochaetia bacterium]